jgi:N6-adenosine-specific RNA methylase IME4
MSPCAREKPLSDCPICEGTGRFWINLYGRCGFKENSEPLAVDCPCVTMKRRGNPNLYDDLRRARDEMTGTEDAAAVDAIPFHPLADIFPLMEGEAFDNLVASIKANGLREPIVLFQNKILDGRNRDRACTAAGVDPVYAPFRGGDPVAFVVDANLHRRHLSESQRAMVAARLAALQLGANQHTEGTSIEGASQLLNVGRASVERAKTVQRDGTLELQRAVEAGKVSVSAAADVATLPAVAQCEIVARGEREILDTAKRIRAEKAEARRAERVQRLAEISTGNTELPGGKYPIIYADPPWFFEVYDSVSGTGRTAESHYPCMKTEQICALPVAELATDDAVLFLWTTSPHLQESFRVIEAWGFRYTTNVCWVKDQIGLGFWIRNQHELLLIATRGNMPAPAPAHRPPSVITAARREHSRKPDEAYEFIERMYPDLPKIELFARGEARPGWAVWGNEAPAAARLDPGEMPPIPDFLRRPLPQERASSEDRR